MEDFQNKTTAQLLAMHAEIMEELRARRFNCGLAPYKRLTAIDARCNEMEAFTLSRPEMQVDWPGEGAV